MPPKKPDNDPNDLTRKVDLDAARRERLEALGNPDPHKVIIGGAELELPIELPFMFVHHANNGDIHEAICALLGDQVDKFFDKASVDDITRLMDYAAVIYGVDEEGKQS